MREAQGKQLKIIIERNEKYNLGEIVLLASSFCLKKSKLKFKKYGFFKLILI